MATYLFQNAGPQSGQRFASLETLYDPWTIQHLEVTGIGPGWQCWEVGGGGGGVAVWLAEQCGSSGHVLVTDIDPRFLRERASLDQPNVEIRHHDISVDPLPSQVFDLIHARLVLGHVPKREQALERMITALKPGGWLMVEDFDQGLIDLSYPTRDVKASILYQKMQAALAHVMKVHNVDLAWGRNLYQRLRAHGLTNIGMEGYLILREGRSPGARHATANFEQIREEAVSTGLITQDEVEHLLHLLDTPDFAFGAPVMFTAWGRRS
jgi:ubiquinone/menaquinone biosynthesis C-methylase UbiE